MKTYYLKIRDKFIEAIRNGLKKHEYRLAMVTKKEDTPERLAKRRYEEKNKEKRQEKSGNFQTMIPRELLVEINAFLKENRISKVDFIRRAYELMKTEHSGM